MFSKGKFNKFVKSHDMFGYTVKLNFNKDMDIHNTIVGGYISIAIKLVFAIYIYLIVMKFINRKVLLSSEEFLIEHEDGLTLEYNFPEVEFLLTPNL